MYNDECEKYSLTIFWIMLLIRNQQLLFKLRLRWTEGIIWHRYPARIPTLPDSRWAAPGPVFVRLGSSVMTASAASISRRTGSSCTLHRRPNWSFVTIAPLHLRTVAPPNFYYFAFRRVGRRLFMRLSDGTGLGTLPRTSPLWRSHWPWPWKGDTSDIAKTRTMLGSAVKWAKLV